jgi:hypothetical protein
MRADFEVSRAMASAVRSRIFRPAARPESLNTRHTKPEQS